MLDVMILHTLDCWVAGLYLFQKIPNWWAASLTADCSLMSNSPLFSIGALSLSVARQHSLIRALQNQKCWLNSITLFLSVTHTSLPPATIFNHLLWNYQNYLPFSNTIFNISRCRNIVWLLQGTNYPANLSSYAKVIVKWCSDDVFL